MSPQVRHLPPHRGTGRKVTVVTTSNLGKTPPVRFDGERYVLFIASEQGRTEISLGQARSWIDAGASYICTWGRRCQEIEDTFDHASFMPEAGEPLAFTLMTTTHGREPLNEALWFAFYTAQPPQNLKAELVRVVVLADSPALGKDCETWALNNEE